MDNLRYRIIPAAKRLDKIDEHDAELERTRKAGECTITEYTLAKHALILKRNKEWATVCKAMGWPIEYNPRTYDPESVVSPRPVRDWSYVGPAIPRDDLNDDTNPEPVEVESTEARKRRRLHYLIFWCWALMLSGLYLWLSG